MKIFKQENGHGDLMLILKWKASYSILHYTISSHPGHEYRLETTTTMTIIWLMKEYFYYIRTKTRHGSMSRHNEL